MGTRFGKRRRGAADEKEKVISEKRFSFRPALFQEELLTQPRGQMLAAATENQN